jgi:predicted O-methyltransferase YrrM
MKTLFEKIESDYAVHKDGWCTLDKANALAAAVIMLRPALVVEVGIWAGRSLIPMALALKQVGRGRLIGIDPWKAKESAKEMTGEDLKWWSGVDHEAIFQQFTKWVSDTGVGPFTEIHRCRSDQFDTKRMLDTYGLIDLLHIDGSHGEQASTYDVEHYARFVRVGGLMYFDDIAWAKKAAEMLPGMGFQRLYIIDGGMMLQRLNYEIA